MGLKINPTHTSRADPESEYWEEYWGKIINEIKRRGLWEKAQSYEGEGKKTLYS